MALETSNMAYGRGSADDMQRLINAISERIARARKELTGGAYNELVSVIKNNWSGQDADKYLKLLDEVAHELDDDYKNLENEITSKIRLDRFDYRHVGQGKIVNSITRK